MSPGRLFLAALALAVLAGAVRAEETFDDAVKKAAADYNQRLKSAADELAATRRRIEAEKAPLLNDLRAAENRIVAAQTQIDRLETGQADYAEDHRKLLVDLDGVRKNTGYLGTLAHDGLVAFTESLSPGESQFLADPSAALGQKLDDASGGNNGQAAVAIADYLYGRARRDLGGYPAPGKALFSGSNQVLAGTFAFVGPETYFRAEDGSRVGTVRPRSGSDYPVAYEVAAWPKADAAAFFDGRPGTVVADASGGKALRLKETRGSLLEHIQKGGLVAYAIIAVGLLSLLMIAQKLADLGALAVDPPPRIQACLALVAQGADGAAAQAAAALRPTGRELFEVGLRFADNPKEILEEHLQSVLLRQRLHYERRLSLLSVIATAAPLMGLLGTVVGMVKTFALITVFGTGNAGKLASGISEVLVATELGLVVAIPTLIAHGFLSNRIQRNLSLLERYALEFVTAAETARAAGKPVAP